MLLLALLLSVSASAAPSAPIPAAPVKRAMTDAEREAIGARLQTLALEHYASPLPKDRLSDRSFWIMGGRMPDGTPCSIEGDYRPRYVNDKPTAARIYRLAMFASDGEPQLDKLRGGFGIDPPRNDPGYEWYDNRYLSVAIAADSIAVVEQDGSEILGVRTTQVRTLTFHPSGRLKSFEDLRQVRGVGVPSPFGNGRCDFPDAPQ